MPDLREQLAEKFRSLHFSWEEGWNLAAADECIRQMEWALRLGTETAGPGFGPPPWPELTAAPDDWTPSKETR